MTNQTPESVIAEVIEYHADAIGSHYDGCYKHHAACLAVKLRDMLREPGAPDAATEQVATVRNLHHKITRYGNDMYSIHAEQYEDDPSSYEDLEPFELCAECYEVEKMICEECGGDAPIGHRSNWPCPTVAALGDVSNDQNLINPHNHAEVW